MDDLISRKWLVGCVEEGWIKFDTEKDKNRFIHLVRDIAPSAQPYSDAELQKMQELEQAELDKAFELGKEEGRKEAQPEWNNHTVACLLAELFDDTCACNYNGIDEWLPEKCEVIDACPNPVGVACWEQYLAWKPCPEPYREDGAE